MGSLRRAFRVRKKTIFLVNVLVNSTTASARPRFELLSCWNRTAKHSAKVGCVLCMPNPKEVSWGFRKQG